MLQMFLLMIGVPHTCFEIALTWSSSKGRTLDTQRIRQEQLIKQVIPFPHRRMVNLAKKETITIGPPGRCVRMTTPYWVKDECYNSWEYVPTIISDRDSDLIGVRIARTRDV